MKFKFEKNLKIVNELVVYFHKLGNSDVHIDLTCDKNSSYFKISGTVPNLSSEELDNLNKTLNTPRQHEVEHYYWNLSGECEFDSELSLIGMMVNDVKVDYVDDVLTINVIREDY